MISEGTPAEVRRYLTATRFDLSKIGQKDLPETSQNLYRPILEVLASYCRHLDVQAVVEIVYTDAAKSEAVVGNQSAVIVHDRYLGQILQMMNRLFLYGCSRETKMVYFHKLASHALSRYGFYREAIFAAKFYASRRGQMDAIEKSKGQHLHGLYTMLQEMVIVFHEYGHVIHRRAPDRVKPLREAVEEWITQYAARQAAPRSPEADNLVDEMIGKETPQNRRKLETSFEAFNQSLGKSVEMIAGRADLIEELVCDAFAIPVAITYWRKMKMLSPDQMFRATVLCFLNLRTLGTIEQRFSSETETDPARRKTRRDGDWNDDSPTGRLYFGLSHMRLHHAKTCAIMFLAGSAEEELAMKREAIPLMDSHTDDIYTPASTAANVLLYSKEVRPHLKDLGLENDFWAPENQGMQRTVSAILHGVLPTKQ